MSFRFGRRTAATGIGAIVVAAACLPIGSASAATLKTLYSFCAKAQCADGLAPAGELLSDSDGNLFGVTDSGGHFGAGTVFELSPVGGKWKERVLYNFNYTNGNSPSAGLIADVQGNLYGTTFIGGKYSFGTAFELIRDPNSGKWKENILHSFCTDEQNCPDGQYPAGGLTYSGASTGAPYDGVSPLYGSTKRGGDIQAGTIFELDPGAGGKWTQKIICSFGFSNCSAGLQAGGSGLIADSAGNIFGAATSQGANGGGAAFELVQDANKSQWTMTTLYSFCALAGCADGMYPRGGFSIDKSGTLYGETIYGGNTCPESMGCGVAFKIAFNGGQPHYSVLNAFCAQADCADGRAPSGNNLGARGILYGTTGSGGGNDIDQNAQGGGTIFKIKGSTATVLYSFCAKAACADGAYPTRSLLADSHGNLFGATLQGGAHNGGTVFELMP